jgi:hypothetical protein
MLSRRRDQILPTIAFSTGVLGCGHTLIDFSMQIPGFEIPVCSVFGMGLAQSAQDNAMYKP